MKLTTLFRLRKPDGTDPVNIEDFNDNFDVIDEELGKRLESTGNASDMTAAFTQASTRTNLKTGEKISASFGKIMKWFADLKTVAFSGSYSDLSNKPSIPSGAAASQAVANNCTTTAAGSVLDARQGKVLMDKANQLSSELNEISNGQAVKTSNIVSDASSENGTMRYMVKSGVCYVVAEFSPIESSEQVLPLFTGLPIPFWGVVYTSGGNNHGTSMTFAVDADGVFKKYYSGVKTSDRYDLCFSYPVAQ